MNSKLFTATVLRRTLGLLAMTVMVASCGTKTNPTDGYDLGGVPQTNVQNQGQEFKAGNLFHIRALTATDQPAAYMEFYEGAESTYKITAQSVFAGTEFKLKADGLPPGVTMDQIDSLSYVIHGTVPVGTAPSDQPLSAKINISVASSNSDTEAHKRAFAAATATPFEIVAKVSSTRAIPIVEPRAPLSVTEGDAIEFSVIVKDPGSYGSQHPMIQPDFVDEMRTPEKTVVNAFPGAKVSQSPILVQPASDQRFEFKGSIDTKALQIPAGDKNVVVRLALSFLSPSGRKSAIEDVDVQIVRKVVPVAPPVATNVPKAPVATNAPAATNSAPAATAAKPPVTNAENAVTNSGTPATNASATNVKPAVNAKPAATSAANAKNAPSSNKPKSSQSKNSKNSKNKKSTSKKKSTPKGAQ